MSSTLQSRKSVNWWKLIKREERGVSFLLKTKILYAKILTTVEWLLAKTFICVKQFPGNSPLALRRTCWDGLKCWDKLVTVLKNFALFFISRIVTSLLQIAQKQFNTLKEANLATADMASQFNDLERLVRGEKVVLWADQINAEESKENQHSEVTALATLSKLHQLPENLFEVIGKPVSSLLCVL